MKTKTVYYNNQIKNSNGNPYFPYSFNQTILPTDKFATDSNTQKFTAEGSNKITQKNSSASFSVKPYWNEKSFTLKVVNDFIVEMSDGTTYTIKADDYTDIPETGLNLFTDEAKKYFESHSTSRVDSNSSSIEWVKNNTINTSVDSSKTSTKAVQL